jgi:hypothetical protein
MYGLKWNMPHRADAMKLSLAGQRFVQNVGTEFNENQTNGLAADTKSRTD